MVIEGYGIVTGQKSVFVWLWQNLCSISFITVSLLFIQRVKLMWRSSVLNPGEWKGISSTATSNLSIYPVGCRMLLSPSLRQIQKKKKKNIASVEGKMSFPLKAASFFFSYFHFEQLFNFPVDVYESWHWLGTNPCLSLLNSAVVSCMPTVLSHLCLSIYLSLSFPGPNPPTPFLSESIDFSSAGNETALPCDSQQERGTWRG